MPLETSITKSIVRYAESRGWWTFKIAGGAFQKAGVPDLLCVRHGLAVFLEVKQPRGRPTPLQLHRIAEIKETGGAVAEVVRSLAEAAEILDGIDHEQGAAREAADAVDVAARRGRRRPGAKSLDEGER
jgi:hypothetical protein